MAELTRRQLSETVRVPLPQAEAFRLFTPLGEREWAVGWEPVFPVPVDDDARPGTVFTVTHGGATSTWLVASCEPGHSIEYTRLIPGRTAARITVACEGRDDATVASVSYDVTPLTAEGETALAAFSAHFAEYIGSWETAIATLCAQRAGATPPA